MPSTPLLVSPSEAKTPNVVILDATLFLPGSPQIPYDEFVKKHIPNSQFLDLQKIGGSANVPSQGFTHMMPSPEDFAETLGKLGISQTTHVVLYDSHGTFSAPRALFMFRAFGHTSSSVLDGGLPAWEAAGFPVESGEPKAVTPVVYTRPTLSESAVASYENIVKKSELILDARPPVRYDAGHMPNSVNLPFPVFLKTNKTDSGSTYSTFLPADEIEKAFLKTVGEDSGKDILAGKQPAITSCGGGVTAGMVWLGLQIASEKSKISLYDESWAGYSTREGSTILKTEA